MLQYTFLLLSGQHLKFDTLIKAIKLLLAMLLEAILTTIALIVLVIASFSDIKKREVPDWLSYGFIFVVVGVRLIFSIPNNWEILISGVLGLAAGFLIACLLYYSNQWGGGDSKLLMGMGALLGITYPFNSSSFTLLWFLIALMLLGAIYGLIWIIGLAIYKRKQFLPAFINQIYLYKNIHLILGIICGGVFLFFLFGSYKGYTFLWPLVPFPLLIFYVIVFITTVESNCFTKKIEVKELTEGDWLAEDIVIGSKIHLKKKTVEKEDLEKIQRWHHEGKLSKIIIREGIPFIPSFLISYLFIKFGAELFLKMIESFL